jgi:hypothetical protein
MAPDIPLQHAFIDFSVFVAETIMNGINSFKISVDEHREISISTLQFNVKTIQSRNSVISVMEQAMH